MTCRVCHCADDYACLTDAGPCWWVDSGLCSACASRTSFLGRVDVWLERPHPLIGSMAAVGLVVAFLYVVSRSLSL